MSMLVGVRGQTRESEGAALREGIIQQPGPFYNGNPSSIIWGNSPTAPLWRDESSTASPSFGTSKQHLQKEEKEKVGGVMVAGEGKASSKGRRHVSRTQFSRNLNANPPVSSPFAFGFPPPPPGSASSSATGFAPPLIPTGLAPGASCVAFGAGENYATGTAGTRSGAILSPQDERMEDIEEVIPVLANLTVKDQPGDWKFSAKADGNPATSGVAQDISTPWASGSDFSGQFSALNLNGSSEPPNNRKDVSGVFVFGAKPPSNGAAAAPEKASVAQAPAPRSRALKAKRSGSAAKGKGIASGNATFSTPPVHSAEYTSDESSSQGFASSSVSFIPVNDNPVPEGLHQSSPEVHSPSESGHRDFVFSGIAKSNHTSGEFNVKSEHGEESFTSKKLEHASSLGHNGSLPSAFSRVTSSRGGSHSSSQSFKSAFGDLSASCNSGKSVSGEREFASGPNDVEVHMHSVEDLSLGFSQKLDLGSVGSIPSDKEVAADRSRAGVPFNTRPVGLSENDPSAAPDAVSHGEKCSRVKRDGDSWESLFSPPANTNVFFGVAKEATVDLQKPSFHSFTHMHSEQFTPHTLSEPFVFGASRPQPTTVASEGSPLPTPFKFTAKASASSSSPSSSTGGGCVSGTASISVSDLLPQKHKSSATRDSSVVSQLDTDAVASSFSCFNLGAKPSVKSDGIKSEGVLPGTKMVTTVSPSFPSGENLKVDSDGECSSYVSAPSRFVFSAGSGSSSSQATAPITPAPTVSQGFATEDKVKEESFATGSSVTSEFFDAQSRSQTSSTANVSFEFRANSGDGSGSGKASMARKKNHKPQLSAPRRLSRSSATSKEKNDAGTYINFVDILPDESGSPMDFSPQRYTPPEDAVPQMEESCKPPSWDHSQSKEKEGLDGDDEWTQYSETDVAIENLRNAANDLTIGSKQAGRVAWEGIGKGEEESFWRGGKENSPGKSTGRNGKWKRASVDENQVPLSGRDNTWAGLKIDSANEPESAASSSTPSVDSSASSSGWGHFTFTAGSSPNLSSATSLLRRHARRIQREKPVPGVTDVLKSTSSKVRGEATSSISAGARQVGGKTSVKGGTTMKRPVFAFDTRVNSPVEAGKESVGMGGNWANEQPKAPSVIFSSRSNSWSTDSSSSLGSLPKADGVGLTTPHNAGAAATEQVCERWRLRGNQAYANGDFPKAEEYYSRGASSVPPDETSQSCIRASMLCYSNRAATRMVVGRMREALADCMRAMAVDPNFLRVRLRAASCHLALGEIEAATLAYKECIRRAKEDDQPDVKVSSEATDGLRKVLQVEEYLDRASGILANWSSGDTPTALRLLNEALLHSPHSERALELKARSLLLLRRYEEGVQLCEQSLVTAERNHPLASGEQDSLHIWRWQVTAKAKYHLGRLEEALEILQKLDEVASVVTADKASSTGTSSNADPLALSITSIRDLLRHKAAGNEAFQNGKHSEAVEHYSAALACNGDSRPFNAVCFCNRAAASQALGNVGDAIADCSRAIALDPKYAKAISRRATLHEKVRDYGQSCHDLRRLIALLEGQQQQARTSVSPGRIGRTTSNAQQDLRQARDRLAKAEDEMKKGHPLDHYMILGLDPSCSSNEIKKAYRKAALRHHPDKAGQFLARSEGGDDGGLWKDVADEVRRDAERLFKLIGEANAILSDTQKRTRYDAEEEFRKLRTRTSSASVGASEMYRSSERTQGGVGRRTRDRWDQWSNYGPQNQRWQSGPDAAQPDTYARRGRYGSNNSSRSNGDGGRYTEYDWDDI